MKWIAESHAVLKSADELCVLSFMTQHMVIHAWNKRTNVLTAFSHVCVMMLAVLCLLCVILHTHSAVVASVRAFFGRVGLTISVPGVGGGLRHVDHVTVTQTRALTPTVTRRVDTVTARWAANTHSTSVVIDLFVPVPSYSCRFFFYCAWHYWIYCESSSSGIVCLGGLHVCTGMTANTEKTIHSVIFIWAKPKITNKYYPVLNLIFLPFNSVIAAGCVQSSDYQEHGFLVSW